MNTHNLSEGYIVENLSSEDLVKITEEVGAVQEGFLCTVQIEEQRNGELSLYGVWENSYEWVENYHNSGGVWSYFRPEHYIQILEAEFKRRGLYAANVRPSREPIPAKMKRKEETKMTGEVYKVITVNGKQVNCIDEIDGFSLEIDGSQYHVYADEDGNTSVDLVMGDEREYIGMINDLWTGDEEEAARFILSFS